MVWNRTKAVHSYCMTNGMQVTSIFSPALYPYCHRSKEFICVIVDVLRATTTMCTMIEHGAKIIPVASLDEAREYKQKGFLVAGERREQKLDFTDFDNSALSFQTDAIKGKTIVHTTTNGTQALELAKQYSPREIVIGAFVNLSSLTNYLLSKKFDVDILCSGWKNTFSLEDSVFAGALSENLLLNGCISGNDATFAAIDLWKEAKNDLKSYLNKASHAERLRKDGLDDVFDYTYTIDACHNVPILIGKTLVDANTKN